MKALIDFISGYEPIYTQVVRGEPEEKIAELEAALGRRLPGAYRDFLSTAAANVGFDTGDVLFDADAVMGLCARWEPIPERFVPVAVDDGLGSYDYYLDFSHPRGQDDALLVRIGAGIPMLNEQLPQFWSLRDALFSWAFTGLRMRALPEQTLLVWLPSDFEGVKKPPSLETLQAVMKGLGFDALAVTSPDAQLYERGDCAASVYRVPFQQTFSLKIAARAHGTMLRVAETVRDAIPKKSG